MGTAVTRTQFFLLGPLMVRSNEAAVSLPWGKQRAVLAALLLNANQVVSLDELTETLWGTTPPQSARVAVQNHVMRLRKALGPAAGSRISTQRRGYLIRADASELDLTRFEAHLNAARAATRACRWNTAAGEAAAGLSLWRGEPLADVESAVLTLRELPRLADLRLQALHIRIDAEVHLGRHASVIDELQQLTRSHPLRERLHALLMLALYRDGRQGEALAAYRQARQVLIDELGTEPGAELRDLHQQILTADPALAPPQRSSQVAAHLWSTMPRELPATVPHFTGRAEELRELTRLLTHETPGMVVISAVGGTAGVGKTALALHWAHQVAGRFPDGQLYVNLRGFGPYGAPAPAAGVIRGFLDALGVPPERVPASPEAQAGLYRSLLSGRRMLIVLDNARDEQQVRPLLPASPASQVIVTSRNQLSGLAATDGARLLTLDVLTRAEAVQLLTVRLDAGRAAAEPATVDQIASLCACLPLALAVAAARAAARPGFALAALAAELADATGRLDALDAGDPGSSVRAVFSWSARQLTDEAARMFRLLGIHPGPDICVPAAASLAAIAEPEARRLLHDLARAHLITEHAPGRYTFHDLLRAYASEQAHHAGSDTGRHEATGRMLDHYLHTAARAALLLEPAKEPVALTPPRPGAAPGQPADHRQAMAWFEAEHHVLLAALGLATGPGFDSHAWQLPWAMAPFLYARGHWQEYAAAQRTALAAATRLGDTAAQALSGHLLANACTHLGDHDQARGHYASSLRLYQRLGNRLGEAKIHHNLGFAAERQGRYADALGHAEQGLRLYQAIGDKTNEAEALNNVGFYHGLLGDYHQARAFCRKALALSTETGNRRLEGYAWDSLGYAEHHLGNLAEAAACFQRALSLSREVGDRFAIALTLTRLGDTRHANGEMALAREAWQQALAILDDLQHPDAAPVRAKLASTNDHFSPNPSA
jgi:DNA-binding SARP family transcriptional activator/tetratricopeptide (TPR) repeat protein